MHCLGFNGIHQTCRYRQPALLPASRFRLRSNDWPASSPTRNRVDRRHWSTQIPALRAPLRLGHSPVKSGESEVEVVKINFLRYLDVQ